jgi:hypothetical protein
MCPVSVQDCVETFIWSDTLISILSYQHQEGQGVSPFVISNSLKNRRLHTGIKKILKKVQKIPKILGVFVMFSL